MYSLDQHPGPHKWPISVQPGPAGQNTARFVPARGCAHGQAYIRCAMFVHRGEGAPTDADRGVQVRGCGVQTSLTVYRPTPNVWGKPPPTPNLLLCLQFTSQEEKYILYSVCVIINVIYICVCMGVIMNIYVCVDLDI